VRLFGSQLAARPSLVEYVTSNFFGGEKTMAMKVLGG
jgi:hypothetical protein